MWDVWLKSPHQCYGRLFIWVPGMGPLLCACWAACPQEYVCPGEGAVLPTWCKWKCGASSGTKNSWYTAVFIRLRHYQDCNSSSCTHICFLLIFLALLYGEGKGPGLECAKSSQRGFPGFSVSSMLSWNIFTSFCCCSSYLTWPKGTGHSVFSFQNSVNIMHELSFKISSSSHVTSLHPPSQHRPKPKSADCRCAYIYLNGIQSKRGLQPSAWFPEASFWGLRGVNMKKTELLI